MKQGGTLVFGNQKKKGAALLCLIAMLIIGDLDYLTGYRVSLLVFYILPVAVATIYVGPGFAAGLALMSIAISIASDYWAGIPAAETPVMYLNAAIALVVFIIAIVLLEALQRRIRRK
jgi:hypothetical protein